MDYEDRFASDQEDNDLEDAAARYYAATFLADASILHILTKDDICWTLTSPAEYSMPDLSLIQQFLIQDRYSLKFQGIVPDTGAALKSTAGLTQFRAL